MRIPKRLRFLGHIIRVVYPHIFVERTDCHALACVDTDQILLASHTNDEPLPEDKVAEHFLHEIGHHISQAVTGEACLGGDEIKHTLICRAFFAILRENDLDFRREKGEGK